MENNYQASLILSAVGDIMGYNNGFWEMEKNGEIIHEQLNRLGGVANLNLEKWRASDDTIFMIATANALVCAQDCIKTEDLLSLFCNEFFIAKKDLNHRAPGYWTLCALDYLKKEQVYQVPYSLKAGGCGAAVRSLPIGLRFPHASQYEDLIRVSVESARITHHNAVGYLGAVTVALFASYAIQRVPLEHWGMKMLNSLRDVMTYVESTQSPNMEQHKKNADYFERQWCNYLLERNLFNGYGPAIFAEDYNVMKREKMYKTISYSGRGGSSGHDAPMIAYDALLVSGDDWIKLCEHAMLHGGDNDSTGIIAGGLFGLLNGMKNVPESHYQPIEKSNVLYSLSEKMYAFI